MKQLFSHVQQFVNSWLTNKTQSKSPFGGFRGQYLREEGRLFYDNHEFTNYFTAEKERVQSLRGGSRYCSLLSRRRGGNLMKRIFVLKLVFSSFPHSPPFQRWVKNFNQISIDFLFPGFQPWEKVIFKHRIRNKK